MTSPLDAAMAAITDTLAGHKETLLDHRWSQCSCGTRGTRGHTEHVADRVRATITGLALDQLAALLGAVDTQRRPTYIDKDGVHKHIALVIPDTTSDTTSPA